MTASESRTNIGIYDASKPGLSVVIPSWNTQELTLACLRSLFEVDHQVDLEVIVVDNGSEDGSPDAIAAAFPLVHLIRNSKNEYYSKACNQGAAVSTKRALCMLNSDTVVTAGALRTMLDYLDANPSCGGVAPRLDNPDGSIQPICRRFPTLFDVVVEQFDPDWEVAKAHKRWAAMAEFDHLSPRDVEQPPGTCLVMRRAEFEALGGFDEDMPLFYSDVDLCLRIWQSGKSIRFLPEARIFHVGSASVVRHPLWRAEFMQNQVLYFRKHAGVHTASVVRGLILTSALNTGARTVLGRRGWSEKTQIIRQLVNATRRALT
jgi:N-acetylglucosaminyl-diphospho-decaprenol L-rhamnosyltransferase